ncbi:hypothetical protein OPV22_015169 [Ensete ventricosum]|uniref:5'-3' exonuclease domain-containing protein n=1 Tax=Ensete ventricosum TaxID=4639 RepID=A0AAV8PLI1_ENSVE|nr:hypothetical protein OPV22_015169 [Ensete ventricosum]
MAVAMANAFGTSQQLRHRPSGPPSLPRRPFAGLWRFATSSHDGSVTEKPCLLGAAVASRSVGNSSKQLAGKRRVFFLDVNPLCFDGSRPSLRSFARWLDLFFSEVSLRDPVIAVLDGEDGNEYRRHLLPSYKAHRKRYLRQSRVLRSAHDTYQSTTECKVMDVLLKCNVPVVKVHGYEADDVVATLTDQVLQKGARVVIGSPDKDFKQLISEDVQIVMPMPDFGRWSFYTLKHYIDQYKCDPSSDLSLRCFMGDEVDGVPGIQQLVPGFGRKTALKLLKKHGSLEDLLSAAAIRTVGKDYAQNALTKYADYLRRNYKVLSLRRDVNVQLQDDWLSERNTSNDSVILSDFLRKLGERSEGQKLNNRERSKSYESRISKGNSYSCIALVMSLCCKGHLHRDYTSKGEMHQWNDTQWASATMRMWKFFSLYSYTAQCYKGFILWSPTKTSALRTACRDDRWNLNTDERLVPGTDSIPVYNWIFQAILSGTLSTS